MIEKLVRRDIKDALTHNTPSENPVIMTQYVDTNLYYGILTERSVIGMLHFILNSHIMVFK